jgi:outer membrane protein W
MSTFPSRPGHRRLLPFVLILLIASAFATSALAAGKPGKIRRLGNPVTAFSTVPAESVAELQSQFAQYRSDFEDVLRQAGWGGDPADLFAAVERGDVERVQVPVGETIQWMAFRRHKKPQVNQNLVWAGKEPFDAWKIEFESAGAVHTFLAPVVCLNLSYYKQGPAYPAPSCSLAADVGEAPCGELAEIRLTGSTDGQEIAITGVRGPGGAGDPAQAMATGSGRWTYKPAAAGSYEFAAVCTSGHGKTASASAKAAVPEAEPCVECRLQANYDAGTRLITLDSGGSVGTVEITGVTLWDGSGGSVGDLLAAGPDRWTYAPVVPKKRGDYVFEFSARASSDGATADCDPVSVTVPGKRGYARQTEADTADVGPDNWWILRLYGARIDGDDAVFTSEFRPDGSNERNHLSVDSGQGVGLGLERLFSRRLGVELGVLLGSLDTRLMRDIDEAWETATESADFFPITLGLNFHLTPGSKVDLYLGPFVGLLQYDDVEYRVLGEHVVADIEDEFTAGAQIGIDVPTGSRWAFSASVRYMDAQAEFQDAGFGGGEGSANELELSIDPLIFTAGVAFRF